MTPLVRLEGVWVEKGKMKVLQDISLEVEGGEFVVVVGPTGAGKSTLLRVLHLDERPTRGRVTIEGREAKFSGKEVPLWRRRVGMIFQDFKLLPDRDVLENVAFALYVTGVRGRKVKRKALDALTSVGMAHRRHDMPYTLSGGEQQRVAIARALAHEPELLLADEPTGNLDREAAEEVLELLEEVHRRGTAIVLATHMWELAGRWAFRRIWLEEGKIVRQELSSAGE